MGIMLVPPPLTPPPPAPPAPVVEELTGLAPWDACRRLAGLPHLLFLDSASQAPLARWSFVTADPFAWVWPPTRLVSPAPVVSPPLDPFECLAEALSQFRVETIAELPPFQGGAAGLFSYDLCHYLERLPRPRYCDFALPDLAVGLYDWVLSFDLQQRKAWLISTGFPETDWPGRLRHAQRRRDHVLRLLDKPAPSTSWQPAEPARIEG